MADSKETGTETAQAAPRLRVHQIAKELGLTSRELITRLNDDGIAVKSPQSVLAADVVATLRGEILPDASEQDPSESPDQGALGADTAPAAPQVLFVSAGDAPPVKTTRRRRQPAPTETSDDTQPGADATASVAADAEAPTSAAKTARKSSGRRAGSARSRVADAAVVDDASDAATEQLELDAETDEPSDPDEVREAAIEEANANRRRRRRGRRGRGGRTGADASDGSDTSAVRDVESDDESDSSAAGGDSADSADSADSETEDSEQAAGESTSTRRRRRRRRAGNGDGEAATGDDPDNTVVHIRDARPGDDGVRGVKGSTRLEAKRQRRRDGRESSRRRPDILTEAEFLARREAVNRVMAVRENGNRTQVAVLEDDVLVEHYVTQASATSYVGNIYLGRVQNVLPSMEAAFVDIGKGRNGVLYAGEVNWDAAGLEGKSRAIENALKSGDPILVQVTKDPIGHKGARLTSQISLPGRFLVFVPGGGMTGISRKLPDTERHRLKSILKKIVPEDAGVIIRTAAEGASEEELTRDVERLTEQWAAIQKKADKTKAAPTLVHGEPDLAIRVVRDVFNEDFAKLVVQGDGAWETVNEYIGSVAPDLVPRISRHTAESDLFLDLRVDEQLTKALDRKVWLPSGGSLVIDRTEAMIVIDVNTGKFIGSGGNLEETVTRNNIEAAEEIVRQLRLRDIGGIVVIDFIDMVLESNRELVLRRLTECLGRDRTKHQVAEVTSLGLVQMTRKRVGEGLLEAFSEPCPHCHGRGLLISTDPVDRSGAGSVTSADDEPKGRRGRRSAQRKTAVPEEPVEPPESREKRVAAMAAIHRAANHEDDGVEGAITADQVARFDEAVAELEMAAVAEVLDSVTVPETDPITPPATHLSAAGSRPPDGGDELVHQDSPTGSAQPTESAQPAPPAEAAESAEPAETVNTPRPRRRRRAASRPAGPPAASTG